MQIFKNTVNEYTIYNQQTKLNKIGIYEKFINSIYLQNDGLLDYYYQYTDLPNWI